MHRRTFLKGVLGASGVGAAGLIAAPAIAQGHARTLRFVPQSNLSGLDPVWTTQNVVRNAAVLIWDTLYGVDEQLRPQRQMVEHEEVSADGLTWLFRLRPGLAFHDGAPVLSRDVVASLRRWQAREPMGLMIKAIENELSIVDDRSWKWVLRKPFPKMLFALAKTIAPNSFVMPERIAATDPFKQITEYVGSGPMRFLRDEWVPGARASFAKFEGYVPREEKASWLAGGKRMLVDRIEWSIMPDQATAAVALQNGEVDWLEDPLPDLVPMLRRNADISVGIADPLGNIGAFRMNHLIPPFDDINARRAILAAINQEDYMRSIVGDDDKLWRSLPSLVPPASPLYNEEGAGIIKNHSIEVARDFLAKSRYRGDPVTCLVPQDWLYSKGPGDVTADLLKKIGFNVDFVATDLGTVAVRRNSKNPVAQGGWNMFHTRHPGVDCMVPASCTAIRANGPGAWVGWPNSPAVESAVQEWFDSTTLDGEKVAARKLNKAALDDVVYAPTGLFYTYQAWRKSVSGIGSGPVPIFWGVSKSA